MFLRQALVVGFMGANAAVPAIDPNFFSSKPTVRPISAVDTSFSRYNRLTLTVDGNPFFYNGVQFRADKTADVWGLSDEDNKRLFKQIHDDGFTVVNSQIFWSHVQPDRVFNATASTYIQGGSGASTNFASQSSVKVAYNTSASGQQLAYFKFDFSSYPYQKIHAAKLRFYINAETTGNRDFSANLYAITNNTWDASKITWNSGAPNHNGGEISGTKDQDYFLASSSPSWNLITRTQYYDFDASDFIINHASGRVASFILQASSTNVTDAIGASIDGINGSKPPQLFLSNTEEFDWTYADKLIKWSEDAGLKFEYIWFGSDSTGVTMDSRTPYFLWRNHKLEVGNDTSHQPVHTKQTDPAYGIYWTFMDKNDLRTRAQEKSAVKALFNHVAEYNARNGNKKTVVGAGLCNEPHVNRARGGYGVFDPWKNPATWSSFPNFPSTTLFYRRTLWEHCVNLANAVKESNYPVWTRVNEVSNAEVLNLTIYNEERRKEVNGTSLDFVSLDPYSRSYSILYNYGHRPVPFDGVRKNYAAGVNFPLVAENHGGSSKAANLLLASLAGGSAYNVYDYYGPDELDLYRPGPNNDYKHPVPRGVYVQAVRKTNWFLKKLSYDLATRKTLPLGSKSFAFLNVFLDNTNTTTAFRSLNVTYVPDNTTTSVGISISYGSRKLTTASDAGPATFKITGLAPIGVESLSSGEFEGTYGKRTRLWTTPLMEMM